MDDTGTDHVNFLAGDGEIPRLLRTYDWSSSSLGASDTWPQVLKTTVSTVLDSRFPMYVAWGDDLILLYNDAYREVLGAKHPASLGGRAREVWAEVWPMVGPLIVGARAGAASYFKDLPLSLPRLGHMEQVWFTCSHSPIRGGDGAVVGVLCVCTETTGQVLAERHQTFRLALGDRIRGLDDPDDIEAVVTEALGQHLGAARVGFGEIDATEKTLHVVRDWSNGALGSLAGVTSTLSDFGPEIIAELRSGHSLRLDDITHDRRTAPYADAYASIGARSLLLIPLIREGMFTTILYLHQPHPHHWTGEDEALTADIAERTRVAVERTSADKEQRKAEQALGAQLIIESNRLRTLFQQAPGFMVVLRGPDHVIELTNTTFQRLVGDRELLGKPVREALPEIEGQRFLS
jgi:PAS domain-containing protein